MFTNLCFAFVLLYNHYAISLSIFMFGEKQNYKAKHKFNNKSEGLHLLPFCVSAYVEDVISHYRLTASANNSVDVNRMEVSETFSIYKPYFYQ
jgi:hypothetical protein